MMQPTSQLRGWVTGREWVYEPPFTPPRSVHPLGCFKKDGESFTDSKGQTYVKRGGTLYRVEPNQKGY